MESTLRYRLEGKVPAVGLQFDGGWITLGEFGTIQEAQAKQAEPKFESFWGFRTVISWEGNEMTTIEEMTWGK